MGQCVSSAHKDPEFGHKYDHQPTGPSLHNFPISSPLKEKHQTVEFTKFDHISRTSSYSYGGEKEAFFDTQPWLDSDCEDDFYSIGGDFTSSRGNTPVHHSFASTEIRHSPHWYSSALASPIPVPGPSPNARKKSLSELFEESGRYVAEFTDDGILGFKAAGSSDESLPTSIVGSPYNVGARSSYSGQKTPMGNYVARKVRSVKSANCCLPRLLLSQSFSKSKGVVTTNMSPVENNG
ncbi:unnamed protein product [Rhodiola kirilowii]